MKKGKVGDLRERVCKAEKPVFIIVPNAAIAERYASLNVEKARVVTMADLKQALETSGTNAPIHASNDSNRDPGIVA